MDISPIELVLGLFVVAVALAYVARGIGVAYPILLVLGGLVLGFLPGLPSIELDPDVVFLLLLPPILFGAAYSTPIRDFRANARPIGLLAVGLVLFTTLVVGVVAQVVVPGIPVAAAFALGAIVAPPDAVAATAIFRRLGVPRRVVTILEGESLVNDASALIAYRFALVAAMTGVFSLGEAGVSFVRIGLGGVVVGAVVGIVLTEGWKRTNDPTLEIMVSLLAPFAAFLPAEALGLQRCSRRRRGWTHRRTSGGPCPVARRPTDGSRCVGHRHLRRSTASRSCSSASSCPGSSTACRARRPGSSSRRPSRSA